MTFSWEVIRELLAGSAKQRAALQEAYTQLPGTRCQRSTSCCSLLPEMNLLEALAAIQLLLDMVSSERLRLSKKLIRYFLLNPVEVLGCPFLQGQNCLIYPNRFFGCRAYGLWSRRYYEEQAAFSREAKQQSRMQWQRLGVSLPQEIVEFQLPYCTFVEAEAGRPVDDAMILDISENITELSEELAPWHDSFRYTCFSDLALLLAAVAFGMAEAVRLKYDIVRAVIATGEKTRASKLVNALPDLFLPE